MVDPKTIEDRAHLMTDVADMTGIPYEELYKAFRRGSLKGYHLSNRVWLPYEAIMTLFSTGEVEAEKERVILDKPALNAAKIDWAEIERLVADPNFFGEVQDQTEGSIKFKYKARYNGHRITVFESDHNNGWTFICDGLKPMFTNASGNKYRAFFDNKKVACMRALEFASGLPDATMQPLSVG